MNGSNSPFTFEFDNENKVIKLYRTGSDEPEIVLSLDEATQLICGLADAWYLHRFDT